MRDERWNHNIHYRRLILEAVPSRAKAALDVGCGDGALCRVLRAYVPHVVGIDVDANSIALAKMAGGDVEYLLGDFLTYPFEAESFDLMVSVASLHHMDAAVALTRMRALLCPGGVLAVVGVARRSAADLPYDLVGFAAHRVLKFRRGYWQHPSPLAAPTLTHHQLRRIVRTALPGALYRKHVLFRYSLPRRGIIVSVSNPEYPTRFVHPPWRNLVLAIAVQVIAAGLLVLVFHGGPLLLILGIVLPAAVGTTAWQWRGASRPVVSDGDDHA
ncbi:MAG: class I SAM-dependent methyltransferase [Actinomycetota bacterium]|nr:class I SAM-dependent methyltransferase [Actinomycetota bacterium]